MKLTGKTHLKDKVVIIRDSEVKIAKEDLLQELKQYLAEQDWRAMSDYQLFLDGQKDMLNQVIKFIENNL
jgi:hypothetical protein